MTSKPTRSPAHYAFFILAILLLAFYFVAGIPLRQARLMWRAGHVAEAEKLLNQWAKLKVRPADYAEALAVIDLTNGKREAAMRHLAALRPLDRSFWGRLDSDEVGERLVALGRYEEVLIYADALGREEDLLFFKAAALVGVGKVDEGAMLLATIDSDDAEPHALEALRGSIAERKKGETRLVLDREGGTIATFDRKTRSIKAAPGTAQLMERAGGQTSLEALAKFSMDNVFESTLDPVVQAAAHEALGDYRASMVAIDVATSEILAVANTTTENIAFSGSYEPGSVVKTLTILAASGVDVDAMFPFDCTGSIEIGGRRFHDWARHDRLESLDEALAVSCNLVFAKLGVAVGAEKLDALLRSAGFGRAVDLGYGEIALGQRKGVLAPDFALATAACGLEFEKSNALHLAMISNAIANGGTFVEPRLIRASRSIVGARTAAPPPAKGERLGDEQAIARLRRAMEAVVTNPRGTGRRAAIDGISIAMKTGTAGERDPSYDSIVIAFAPAQNPKIAIGIIAEGAGPAEIAGAQITRDFFAALTSRLK